MTRHNDKVITLTLTFAVRDEEELVAQAQDAIRRDGNGVAVSDNDLGELALELLLHSNPDIGPYLDYGIELLNSEGMVL